MGYFLPMSNVCQKLSLSLFHCNKTGHTEALSDWRRSCSWSKILSFGDDESDNFHCKISLMLGKIEGRRRKGQQRTWLDGITDSVDMGLSKLREMVKDREDWYELYSMWSQRVRHDWVTQQQQTHTPSPVTFTLITWLRQCLPDSSTNSNVTVFPCPNSVLWNADSIKSTLGVEKERSSDF